MSQRPSATRACCLLRRRCAASWHHSLLTRMPRRRPPWRRQQSPTSRLPLRLMRAPRSWASASAAAGASCCPTAAALSVGACALARAALPLLRVRSHPPCRLDGVVESVLSATGELRIAYDNGTIGTMSLQEAKELCGACAIEE